MIKFDAKRFENGEVAVNAEGVEFRFLFLEKNPYTYALEYSYLEGGKCYASLSFQQAEKTLFMKEDPRCVACGDALYEKEFNSIDGRCKICTEDDIYQKEEELEEHMIALWKSGDAEKEDGWIKHDGGECPIPWAKGEEYEVIFQNGARSNSVHQPGANYWTWSRETRNPILAYRLTSSWISVLDGKWPVDAPSGTEVRFKNGSIITYVAAYKKGELLHDVKNLVAVRPPRDIQTCKGKNCGATDGRNHSVECQAEYDLATGVVQVPTPVHETSKQRLTREAWERYIAKHPIPAPVPAITEDGMLRIFGEALEQFEKQVKRKRG